MKTRIILAFLFITITTFSQKKSKDYNFGFLKPGEREMITYDLDTTANAIVLFEQGHIVFYDKDHRAYTRNTIYKKIKILNKDGIEHADVSIFIYNSTVNRLKEKIVNIKAITHNSDNKTSLQKSAIYRTRVNENWTEITFAMPNVQKGSVIEYSYEIESPYLYNFTGWNFQSDIPKIESVFKAEIPGNYIYNRRLVGTLRLSTNEATVKRHCFSIEGVAGESDCEILTYAMKDIPAFIEEDYMTSKKNFISRIDFEFSEHKRFDGKNTKYTTTWDAVDSDYKKDKDIGGQLKRKSFFEKLLPVDIMTETDDLVKAKKAYTFIQNHFTWNDEYKLFRSMNVKKAYNEGIGTVGEINISLINALDASGINAELVLLSTRKNGFPTKIHPVITDFNYIIAKVVINNKTYFLDATEKFLPFGVLPYRCLNRDARVMDFDNGSYWEDIIPITNSGRKTTMMLELTAEGNIIGKMRVQRYGYLAYNRREHLNEIDEDDYLSDYEAEHDFLTIGSYENFNLDKIDKSIKEEFEIIIEDDLENADRIYLYPFFMDKISENPFKLDFRQYPVDFGYSRKFDFLLTLEIPDEYEIESLPKNKGVALSNNGGSFKYSIDYANYKIRLKFSYSLNKAYFYSNEYQNLKELFKQIILAQSEPIILKKIK